MSTFLARQTFNLTNSIVFVRILLVNYPKMCSWPITLRRTFGKSMNPRIFITKSSTDWPKSEQKESIVSAFPVTKNGCWTQSIFKVGKCNAILPIFH